MPVTLVKSSWQSGNLVFEQVTSGAAIHFGIKDTGLDVKFWGSSSKVYMLWDESADNLICASTMNIDMSADKAMMVFKAGDASSKVPTTHPEAGWLNVHLADDAASSIVYIPYYASA